MQISRHENRDIASKIKFVGSKITIKKSKYIQLKKHPEQVQQILNNPLLKRKGKNNLKTLEKNNKIPSLQKILLNNELSPFLSSVSEEKSTKETSVISNKLKLDSSGNNKQIKVNKNNPNAYKSKSILIKEPYKESLNHINKKSVSQIEIDFNKDKNTEFEFNDILPNPSRPG